jgi:ATP-dependent helicase HepA
VFAAERETLEAIQVALSRKAQIRCGVFHEDLSPAQRDIEVAQFRLASGPSILVSTECGGEGRNFQFCSRLVLFDLPWNPQMVEQRIGRLDRIGRKRPVKIVYFRPPAGLGRVVAEVYDSLGIFREPMGGIDRELQGIEAAIVEAALDPRPGAARPFEATLAEVRAAQQRSRAAVYRELIREPYRPEMAQEILASIPEGFEELTQDVVLAACEAFGFHVEEQRGRSRYSVEFGNRARIDSLPGVAPGTSFLGTFDREEGVEDESIDFFSSGHPLVEGVLAGLEDSTLGRTAVLTVESQGERGLGVGVLYAQRGSVRAAAIDSEGRFRPEWAEAFARRPLRTRRLAAATFTQDPGWSDWVQSLAAKLEPEIRPIAAVLLVVNPSERSGKGTTPELRR